MKRFDIERWLAAALTPVGPTSAPTLSREPQDVPWPQTVEVAGLHLVSPSLAGALQRKGLFEDCPIEVRQYLNGISELNRKRNRLLKTGLNQVLEILNGAGIHPLLLKGSICLVSEQYQGCRDRVIGDLDLAVPEDRLQEAQSLLLERAFRLDEEFNATLPDNVHHLPPLLHGELPVSVELHRDIVFGRHRELLPTPAVWRNALPGRSGALEFRMPDMTTRVLHTFVHTQLQDRQHRRLRVQMRPMLEFVSQICAGTPIDWDRVRRVLDGDHQLAFRVYIEYARTLFGLEPPAGLEADSRARRRVRMIQSAANSSAKHRLMLALEKLKRLPRRLLTPAWYVGRIRSLRS